jgi:hypothetical protein
MSTIKRYQLATYGNRGDLLLLQGPVKGVAATSSALPATGNVTGDARIALDIRHTWTWSGSSWADQGLSLIWEPDLRTLSDQDITLRYALV